MSRGSGRRVFVNRRVYSGAADHEWMKGVVEPLLTSAETTDEVDYVTGRFG